MGSPLESIRQRSATPDEEPWVVRLSEGTADEVLDALGVEARRRVLRELVAEPATTSGLADRLDTSVQHAHYHVQELVDAGLVEPLETVYSEKGNEMTVYAPAHDPVVLVGDESRYGAVRRSVGDVTAGLGLLAVASLLVQWGAERLVRADTGFAADIGPAGTGSAGGGPPSVAYLVFEVVEPGLLFFAVVLCLAALVANSRS